MTKSEGSTAAMQDIFFPHTHYAQQPKSNKMKRKKKKAKKNHMGLPSWQHTGPVFCKLFHSRHNFFFFFFDFLYIPECPYLACSPYHFTLKTEINTLTCGLPCTIFKRSTFLKRASCLPLWHKGFIFKLSIQKLRNTRLPPCHNWPESPFLDGIRFGEMLIFPQL